MLHDYVTSLIRTAVPVAVASVLAWLASTAGIVLDSESSTGLTLAVGGLAIAGYYALVRALEQRWPVLGRLLGKQASPTYKPPA